MKKTLQVQARDTGWWATEFSRAVGRYWLRVAKKAGRWYWEWEIYDGEHPPVAQGTGRDEKEAKLKARRKVEALMRRTKKGGRSFGRSSDGGLKSKPCEHGWSAEKCPHTECCRRRAEAR